MIRGCLGDRAFRRRVLRIAVPIIIQNGITNFVSLLDNIMVGQTGTVQMSGVAIVNQLIFVFNLCIFGAMSGAGIFTAQFFGNRDHRGVRHTFRFKIWIAVLLSSAWILLFLGFGQDLIRLYLRGEGSALDAARSLAHGSDYLRIMLLGLLPFALSSAYADTLRETGQTTVPMAAGIAAVAVNLFFNDILIFGHLGAPALGVRGAAIATVLSRFVELILVAGWTHLNAGKNPFIQGAYHSLWLPGKLLSSIIRKGTPLMVNEVLWSMGLAAIAQSMSIRGLEVVAAVNIATTLCNLGNVVYLAMGNTVGVIIGQMLGAGKPESEIRETDHQLTVLAVLSCLVFSVLMVLVSGVFPGFYNTTEEVRRMAMMLICTTAVIMPLDAYCNAAYFTLRSGGQTMITFLFDCCFVWCVSVPTAYCLSRFTAVPIVLLYGITFGMDFFKCLMGYTMVRRGRWIRNLAAEQAAETIQ